MVSFHKTFPDFDVFGSERERSFCLFRFRVSVVLLFWRIDIFLKTNVCVTHESKQKTSNLLSSSIVYFSSCFFIFFLL